MPRTVQRAHKLRLYPTAEQRSRLEAYFGAARWVWNRALEFRSKAYRRRGESVTGVDFSRLLTRLKRTRCYGWLREIPSTVLTQKLRDQDRAFANFFAGRAGYPKFRKRRTAQAIRFQLDQRHIERTFDANDRRLVVPGLGAVKLKWSRRPHCPDCTEAPGCPRCPKPQDGDGETRRCGAVLRVVHGRRNRCRHRAVRSGAQPDRGGGSGAEQLHRRCPRPPRPRAAGAAQPAAPASPRRPGAQAPPARLGPVPGPAAAHRPAAREGGRCPGELPAPGVPADRGREPSPRDRDAQCTRDDAQPVPGPGDRRRRLGASCAGRSPTRRSGRAAPTSRSIRGSRAPDAAARVMRRAKGSRWRTAAGGARPVVSNTTATSTRREISSRKACACSPHNGRRDPVGQCAWRVTPPGCSRLDPGVVRYPMKRERTPRGQGGPGTAAAA